MSDIVERLRGRNEYHQHAPLYNEAADEIERLRDLWTGREDEINQLRLALREIASLSSGHALEQQIARAALEGK